MTGDEFERIARIERALGATARAPSGGLGIGDDAAVLDLARLSAGERLVWTIDAAVEGVHFLREWLSMRDVGRRATVAAASDLLAMGARPLGALVGWTMPEALRDDQIEEIALGQRDACEELGMALLGGNLSSGPVLSLTTTAVGVVATPVLRSGARLGDVLVLLGPVGEAALGLRCLRAGRSTDPACAPAVRSFRAPPVLSAGSAALARIAHAMIDVSDGLAQDAGHLAHASGVRVILDVRRIAARRAPWVEALSESLSVDPLELELGGGEDYALCAAVPAGAALPAGVDAIGSIEVADAGAGGAGVWVRGVDGALRLPPEGFRHGRAAARGPEPGSR
jgi:thiamine-monophosphate kinase